MVINKLYLQLIGIGAAIILIVGTLGYCAGKRNGSINADLATNKTQIISRDSVQHIVDSTVSAARGQLAPVASTNTILRTQVKVVHDTVTTPGGRYVDSTLAQVIRSDSATINRQGALISALDGQNASLREGIALRDKRITLLESQGVGHLSHGLQVGTGYCQSAAKGGTPCVYVGYGFSFRF